MKPQMKKPSAPCRGLLGQRHDLGQSSAQKNYTSELPIQANAPTWQNGRLA